MSFFSRLSNAAFRLLPENELLYRFCRKVVNRHNGDNDVDIATNGERILMERVVPSARCIFDVGANVGDWTADALALNPAAQYHLFEPSPSTFRILQAKGFPPANVTVNNAGLGAVEGELELFVYGDANGANSLYDRRGTVGVSERSEKVRITTLDAYCASKAIEHIDLLKIDVEGHELAVLRGAAEMLRRGSIDVIQFEYGGTYIDARTLLRDIWDLLAATNPRYSFLKLHHDGPRRVPAYRQEVENFQYSNWVIASDAKLPLLTSR